MSRADRVAARGGPVERLAARLGMRSGQLWTLLVGAVLALVLLLATYPAALRAERPTSPGPTPGAPR